MDDWDGNERRKYQQTLLEEAAKRGAQKALRELGVSEEDKETIRGFIKIINGAKATRSLLIWIAGVLTALASIYYIVAKIFHK